MLTHPTQWDAATDDACPAAAEFRPNEDERIVYLEARRGRELVGILTLIPENAVCFQLHFAGNLSRIKTATAAARAVIAWAFRNTPARRVVASIPATNRLAIALAKRTGLTQYGVNSASFLKRGQLVDQILLGISK